MSDTTLFSLKQEYSYESKTIPLDEEGYWRFKITERPPQRGLLFHVHPLANQEGYYLELRLVTRNSLDSVLITSSCSHTIPKEYERKVLFLTNLSKI